MICTKKGKFDCSDSTESVNPPQTYDGHNLVKFNFDQLFQSVKVRMYSCLMNNS